MRRALIIGAESAGLNGVHNDVDLMSALLDQRGFAIERRTKADATRAGILEGLERLISNAANDDAVVIYYTGHGGMAQVTAPDGLSLPDLQVILPTDYDQSCPGDFRGITEIELSVSLARLTERTCNVTLILDCCHAAHMARGPLPCNELRLKSRPIPSYLNVAEHIGKLLAQGLRTDLLHPISNPCLVRLVACGPWGSAYEYNNANGVSVGLATDSLRIALDDIGSARVTWAALAQRIRARVSALASDQRPEAEGPCRRWLFELEQAPGVATFSVVRPQSDRLFLPGVGLLGVGPGDRLAITAAGVDVADDSTIVADATVIHTDGVNARATFALRPGHQDLPKVAEAHPVRTSQPRYPVTIHGDGPLVDQLRLAIAGESTLAEPAAAGPVAELRTTAGGDDPVGPHVRVVDDELALWDGGTVPLRTATGNSAGIQRIRTDLVRLARTTHLRRLTPPPGYELTDQFTVDWGQVVAGDNQPLPACGAQLHVGTPIYLRFRNDSERDLYFVAYDLGVAGAVTLLMTADPSGLLLRPRQEHVFGQRDGILTGSRLVWPSDVPTADPRLETILTIVTSEPQDLGVLTIGDTVARGDSTLEPDPTTSGVRVRYAVVRLDLLLDARTAPAE